MFYEYMLRFILNKLIKIKCFLHYFIFYKNKNKKWEFIQRKYKNIPGEKGKLVREKKYRKFFSKIGHNVCIDENVFFEKPETIVLNDHVKINKGCHFTGGGGIFIGSHTLIGPYVFMTSINHRLYDPHYFFQKSFYEKEIVIIKEHCLISSHVKIMPGVNLESGSFIASGSVVTRGNYTENSFVCGVPSQIKYNLVDKQKPSVLYRNFTENHVVALLIVSKEQFLKWSFFIKSLGFPQIICIHSLKDINKNIKDIILVCDVKDQLSNIEKNIKKQYPNITVWIPIHFKYALYPSYSHKIVLQDDEKDDEHILEIPHKISYICIPSKSEGLLSKERIYFLTCKYALRILEKSNSVSVLDSLYGFYLAKEIETTDPIFFRRLMDSIGRHINFNEIGKTLEKFMHFSTEVYKEKHKEVLNLINGIIPNNNTYSYDLLKSEIIKSNDTVSLCLNGLISYLNGYQELYELAHDKIFNENVCAKTSYIQSNNKTTSYYYRPLLSFFLSKKYKNTLKTNPIIFEKENIFEWEIKTDRKKHPIYPCDFFDDKIFSYSFSMMHNTELVLENFSCESGREFLIHDSNYCFVYPLLQKLWSCFLKTVVLSSENKCIQLLPWPNKKKYAVSLRYDVDRLLNFQDIYRINQYIKDFWGTSCASWYFFKSDHAKESKKIDLLISYHHEIGLHSLGLCLLPKNIGVTFHSGPTSMYWSGIKKQEGNHEPLYLECLHTQTSRPTRVVHGDSDFLVTSLHLPMELSTQKIKSKKINDDFHEFLSKNIRIQIDFNGHIILGSHPDIQFSAIESMREKFNLHEGWCAPVNDVAQRIDTVYYKSDVKIFKYKEIYFVKSNKNLINQSFNVYQKNGGIQHYNSDIKANDYHEILTP